MYLFWHVFEYLSMCTKKSGAEMFLLAGLVPSQTILRCYLDRPCCIFLLDVIVTCLLPCVEVYVTEHTK